MNDPGQTLTQLQAAAYVVISEIEALTQEHQALVAPLQFKLAQINKQILALMKNGGNAA